MILPVLFKTVAAGVAATLAACSATNMYETHQVLRTIKNPTANSPSVRLDSNNKDDIRVDDIDVDIDDVFTVPDSRHSTSVQVVETLRGMKRKELLQIFLAAEAPSSIDLIPGQWTGILLDNRSWVMVSATFAKWSLCS